nr:UDP-glucosyltransferase 29-like [Ziziphus jujuba var. spinosa]
MMDATQKTAIKVLMLPWLAHGHITPFLELAKKLILRNFHIYFCSSPINLNSIKPKLLIDPNFSNSIQLVELHLPSLPDLPPHYYTMKGLPPHLLPTLEKALDMTKPELSKILETLKPDLLIYDRLPIWLPDLASSMNIQPISFITGGAAMTSFLYHCIKCSDRQFPFPKLYPDFSKIKFTQESAEYSSTDSGRDSAIGAVEMLGKSRGVVLIRTSRELEGKYMDYLYASLGKKVVPVGSLVPDVVLDDEEGMDIINWLDKKEKSSTVLVSFGTECYLSKENMEEMAHGLEISNVNFIWVVRFPKGGKMKLDDGLPEGFLGRVKERGIVVENWAPQIKVLHHSSIGGFVSHCGWGSVMESIKFGVPIIAMPMQVDQPWNARLVDECGVGLEVNMDNNGKLKGETLAKVIKQVVVEKTGEQIRRKAKEMSEKIGRKDEEEIDGVVKELLELCKM